MLAAGISLLAACKRDDDTPPAPPLEGGKGGNATLKVTPQHHAQNVDSCTIYIKYAAQDAPADGNYDESAKCVMENGKPVATISNLKKGSYYLYGEGWDINGPYAVRGGIPYVISEETTLNINVPVTETHE